MYYTIRHATKDDCPRLMELVRELAVYEKASEQVTVTLAEFEDAGFGQHPVWGALVAESNDQIIGMSLYYVRYSTWKGRRLYLEDLIVTGEHRGKGAGKRLLDETIAFAKRQGYSGLSWQVLDWNTPAIEFYKTYGAEFDSEWINVSIRLDR